MIVGNVVQTTPVGTYDLGICDCGVCSGSTPVATCNPGDWQYATRPCCGTRSGCPAQPSCSKVDPTVCPTFGGLPAVSASFSQAPNVTCSYTLNQFSTTDDITKYLETFGQDNQYNNTIMPAFCSGTATGAGTCPAGVAGAPFSCSRLMSTGADGNLCRQWAVANPTMADTAIRTYCKTPGAFGCDCVNRQNLFHYRAFKQYINVNDACWYTPCTNPSTELITSDLTAPSCPSGFCDTVSLAYNNQKNNISFQDAQALTVCPLTPPINTTGRTNWFLLALWIILIIIVIGILVMLYYRRPGAGGAGGGAGGASATGGGSSLPPSAQVSGPSAPMAVPQKTPRI